MARRNRKRDDTRARYNLSAELCGREDCDARVKPGFPPLVIRQFRDHNDFQEFGDGNSGIRDDPDNLNDVVLNLYVKDRRALAKGLWAPTRQELIAHWQPTEKQLHPVVQGALNRDHFYVPPFQWLKEIHADGNIVDLACFVWKGGYTVEKDGVHAFEIKRKENGDKVRLTSQIKAMTNNFHFAWLIRIDADPSWDDDKRVGLIRYDLQGDAISVVRDAERLMEVKNPEPYRHFEDKAKGLLKRLKAQADLGVRTLDKIA